jgi:hypothetical protein
VPFVSLFFASLALLAYLQMSSLTALCNALKSLNASLPTQ